MSRLSRQSVLPRHAHPVGALPSLAGRRAGANDTANAAGPYAAVQHMYIWGLDACGAVQTPLWVLAFCGLGIVLVSTLVAAPHDCSMLARLGRAGSLW